jgi:hypothetical protein
MTAIGVNLWATAQGQSLHNGTNQTNDVFHAIYNDVKMNGGAGGDHFHIKAGTTGATIQDFRYDQGDLIVLDGLKSIDPTKFSVVRTGQADYTITYDKTTFKIEDLRQGNGQIWDISAEKLKAQLFPAGTQGKYVRLGNLDPLADYYHGFANITAAQSANNLNKTFQIHGERPIYITGFSGDKNRHNLAFSSNLATPNGSFGISYDQTTGNIVVKKDTKVVAYLSPPAETLKIGDWYNNTVKEIEAAAKKIGQDTSTSGTVPENK